MKTEKKSLSLHKGITHNLNVDMEVDLERALELCGAGKYQVFHCALMVAILGAAILEMVGCSFILPAAACDLDLSNSMRGIITSLPNIGVIITAPFWGRAADTFGRKPVLLFSTSVSGIIGLIAAFMPSLLSFGLCKFLGSLFLSCPSSLGFAYVGELMPKKRRDLAVLICNASLMLVASLCPIIAWGALSYDWWNSPLNLRSWRVLTAMYVAPLILAALWLTQAKESPKFLMTKGEDKKALDVLKHIYASNSGRPKENYCVTSLKFSAEDNEQRFSDGNCELGEGTMKNSAFALLRPPHVKWLALTGFLMFGLFSLLNGLFLFAPDTINKMMTHSSNEPVTICTLMNQPENLTLSDKCVDQISFATFEVTVVTSLIYGTLVMLISLSPLAKRTSLICMFVLASATCLVSAMTTNRIIAGVSMSALQITALGIGPITAYSVQLFPTSLRATAIGAVMMFGRMGSVIGANVTGIFLAGTCTIIFYIFSALLILCAGLSFLLPNDKPASNEH
ncbi:putative transporter svop-1 [Nymphalis io]|uniref:putative transporter svop-1 n=1 Tax=Inachis io TaxID=171585 RepID=UPI002169ECB8|nr:putative transporter svop-1 [Nymphalis io]XP_050349592.1 putative transporter svop-1 [Nymphalis io]